MRMLTVIVVTGALVAAIAGRAPPRSAAALATPAAESTGHAGEGMSAASDAAPIASAGETVLLREANGHFFAEADVNYGRVRFLVDTGATEIALAEDDARRIGLAIDPSRYAQVGQGASGPVMGQVVQLDWISVDGKRVEAMPAVVIQGGDTSLLGQSFLARLESVRIEGDRMILR